MVRWVFLADEATAELLVGPWPGRVRTVGVVVLDRADAAALTLPDPPRGAVVVVATTDGTMVDANDRGRDSEVIGCVVEEADATTVDETEETVDDDAVGAMAGFILGKEANRREKHKAAPTITLRRLVRCHCRKWCIQFCIFRFVVSNQCFMRR